MSERDLVDVDGDILVCAFRYALGRQSYMVDTVATFVARNADRLRPGTRALIVREIDEARARGGLGMDCDERCWMRVRACMVACAADPSPPAPGEHERVHSAFMRGSIAIYRDSADGMPGLRCGLGDAAHLADAMGRDLLAEHAGYRGQPTKLGERLAAVATRIGDAIWAVRQETYEAKAEAGDRREPADV